jgi:hypothetical protein
MVCLELDIRLMKQMHPLLPATTAVEYSFRAALALEHRGHASGRPLGVLNEQDAKRDIPVHWEPAGTEGQVSLDRIRITEDGAEAVALVLGSVVRGWTVRRRLQRGESADWLLKDGNGALVALEVSGIDGQHDAGRLREKLDQVAGVTICSERSACVVAFETPVATLASV